MSGDTWGISGPAFLSVYVVGVAVAAVVVAAAVVRTRRMPGAGPARQPPAGLSGRPYDVAYLNGGADLALCAALSAMRAGGTIVAAGGTVVAAGAPDPRAEELEWAVHRAAAAPPVARERLVQDRAVGAALDRIEGRLVEAGLLFPEEARFRMHRAAAWILVLAGFGGLRVLAGIANGKPVGFLLVLVGATVILALVQRRIAPRRTPTGDAALRRLADEHHVLSPALRPDWTAYGPAAAALGVGVFGVGALWASDPAFAIGLALQRAAATGSFGGSGSGSSTGSGGSDSSCGSGSSCSSGSSCGSGSSGGGGGGGCGG